MPSRHIDTLVAALLVLLASCSVDLESGQFRCQPDVPGSCPAGWICQIRAAGDDWRCYQHVGGYCGDGVLDRGEDCDDIQFAIASACETGYPYCLTNCRVACTQCGNGVLESTAAGPREECDDKNDVAGDGCSPDCKLPRCGDGTRDEIVYEGCDDGERNSDDPDAACRKTCQRARCGDTIVDRGRGEVCDDGNGGAGDGCTPDCRSLELCGNGIVDYLRGEVCDDGNPISHDGCSSTCLPETPAWREERQGRPALAHAIAYDASRDRIVLFVSGDLYDGPRGPETWEWDGANWLRLLPARSPSPRTGFSMAYDGARHRVVVFGGRSSPNTSWDDIWEWDGKNWTELRPDIRPRPRAFASMTYDSARRTIVLFGGYENELRTGPLADTWEWDGQRWTRRVTTTQPAPRSDSSIAYDPVRGRVLLFGGGNYLNDTWEWDGTDWRRLSPAIVPAGRASHALVYDASRGVIVLFGGYDANFNSYADTWEWSGTNWAQRPAPVAPPGGAALLTYDIARRTSMRVASASNGVATWRWNGKSWSEVTLEDRPRAREWFGFAYDAGRGKAVIFGGNYGGPQDWTWEWDGSWKQRHPTTVPPARSRHAMTYDAARRRVVVFGGDSSSGTLNDTWEWDGVNWTQRSPMTTPAPRQRHALAYDDTRQRVVLFSGDTYGDSDINDTWEWDGQNWTRRDPTISPRARWGHAMTYDSAAKRVLLIGRSRYDEPDDTWEWDGTTWTQRMPEVSPYSQSGHAVAYNAARQTTILFGGWRGGGMIDETWEWDGAIWRRLNLPTAPLSDGLAGMVHHTAARDTIQFGTTGATWRFRYDSAAPDESCRYGVDRDEDGLMGCDDPDCWGYCRPFCSPAGSCDPSAPHCGDGTCSQLENCRLCAQDCGACALTCGDFLCDPGETMATCPGDCTPE